MALLHPRATRHNFRYTTTFFIVGVHLLALFLAPSTLTWPALVATIILYYLTGGWGVTMSYHRLLTHRSFKLVRPLKILTTFFACISLEGGPLWWTSNHRLHHLESDKDLDPHSPNVSIAWAHVLWLFFTHPEIKGMEDFKRHVPDLVEDPDLRFFESYFLLINILFLAGLTGFGYWLGGPGMALSMFVWPGLVRIVIGWHITWFVNSVTHVWGYQNYDAKDDSRNLWWVALVTFGEGWHNNHHAEQRSASYWHRWFEVDITYMAIQLLAFLGLASDVVPIARKRKKPPTLQKTPTPV